MTSIIIKHKIETLCLDSFYLIMDLINNKYILIILLNEARCFPTHMRNLLHLRKTRMKKRLERTKLIVVLSAHKFVFTSFCYITFNNRLQVPVLNLVRVLL